MLPEDKPAADRVLSGASAGRHKPDRPESYSDYREHAQALAREFEKQDVHPVIIVGTGGSGKTMMLQSLLAYALSNEEAGFIPYIGDSVFPAGYPDKAIRDNNAAAFYDDAVAAFRRGELSTRTQLADGPFFLPITIKVAQWLKPLRFAFMESMGEWYEREPIDEGTRTPKGRYRLLRWELATLFATREAPISVIFMAPTIGIDNQTREYSHECMANAMSQYQKVRIAKQRDNILLLASKWDALCNPDDQFAHFADATAEQALDEVKNWVVWPHFCGIDGLREGARAFSPYSAARVSPVGVMTIGGQHAAAFNQFNRTIWNWLYGNATEPPFSERKRPVLYPDVVPRFGASMPIHQLLVRIALYRRGQGRHGTLP